MKALKSERKGRSTVSNRGWDLFAQKLSVKSEVASYLWELVFIASKYKCLNSTKSKVNFWGAACAWVRLIQAAGAVHVETQFSYQCPYQMWRCKPRILGFSASFQSDTLAEKFHHVNKISTSQESPSNIETSTNTLDQVLFLSKKRHQIAIRNQTFENFGSKILKVVLLFFWDPRHHLPPET